jgi:acetyl/propionyl-CoA carboxylase alpha subunit
MDRAISEALLLWRWLCFIEKYVGSPRHIEIKPWQTVMGMCCIYSKENAASSVVTKSN